MALGFKTAGNWDEAQLTKKIRNLPDLADGAKLEPKMQKRVNVICNALKKGMKVVVIDLDDVAAGKKRAADVEAAVKREARRKTEKKAETAKKEKQASKKAAGKEKGKAQAKKAVAASDKKSNRDAWGSRLGTYRSKVNIFLMNAKTPFTLPQIIKQAKKAGASGKGAWGGYLDSQVEAGYLKKNKDGAYIAVKKSA